MPGAVTPDCHRGLSMRRATMNRAGVSNLRALCFIILDSERGSGNHPLSFSLFKIDA